MPFMYHPELATAPDYNPIWVADDAGLIRVKTEEGWGIVEPPEQTDPALAAVQPGATYVVKNPELGVTGDYVNFTVTQLQGELEDRGLPKSGTKDELIARLVEDDETN